MRRSSVLKAVAGCALLLGAAVPLAAQADWPMYGHDPASTRYSPLHQIDRSTVSQLKLAWTTHLEALAPKVEAPAAGGRAMPGRGRGGAGGFRFQPSSEATPIMAGGVLYLPSPLGQILALVPETGKEIWHYDIPGHSAPTLRGVSYWPGDKTHPAEILFGTNDGHLMALEAQTGLPVSGFGEDGAVDMKAGIRNGFANGFFSLSSPPAIYKDLVITGARVQESPSLGFSGDTRAWDVRTGKLVWRFHNIPRPGETGSQTWQGDDWKNRSGTNDWGLMSLDPKLGLVFTPVGAPTYDYYGGDRPGANLFGDSVVALDASTGALRWYFQGVHHDLWDYDFNAAPVLFDMKYDGHTIPALAEVSKQGYVFILDRRNGKPVFGVDEKPIPPSDVPGEHAWPTEPVPRLPLPLGRHSFNPSEIARVTPAQEAYCTNLLESGGGLHNNGPFTRYGLKPSIVFPGTLGETSWWGASYDPEAGYLIVNTFDLADVDRLVKAPAGSPLTYRRTGYDRFWNPNNYWPCQQPPWGQLTAIDVNTGQVAWQVPFGVIPELDKAGVHDTGAPNFGGTITTAGGLIFAAATNDHIFRAIDVATGKTRWSTELPAGAYVTPMTYMGKDGKQYVALIATGGGNYDKTHGDSVMAFALP